MLELEKAALRRADRTVRTGRGTKEYYARVLGPVLGEHHGPLLDVGAGDSPYGEGLPRAVRLDPGYRQDPPRNGSNCIAAICENIPFRDRAFGTVLAFFVLQHVNEVDRCVAELIRISSRDGIIVIYPVWRRRRWRHDAEFVTCLRVGGPLAALVIRRPPDLEVERIARAIAVTGALLPPPPVRWAAAYAMRVLIAHRGTTRLRVRARRRRRSSRGAFGGHETA
jgi:SAM-dependent methyltransferase